MAIKKVQLPDNNVVPINDDRIHIYRSLTGTAAITTTPFYCSRWDVTDDSISEYEDGMVVCLKVPVAGNGTYGTGLQINALGYKPMVYNVSSAITTRYSVGSVVWAVYNATQTATLYLDSDTSTTVTGCFQVMDYNEANSNTIGYYLRTYNATRPMSGKMYRYRICFSSADDTEWVPANLSTSTNTTALRDVNQTPINPFGHIAYYSTTAAVNAGSSPSSSNMWRQYVAVLGYSFNRTGAALVLDFPAPVYVKCAPQADGSAIIDSTTPYVQELPTTADGKIYIYLGMAYDATHIELVIDHPIYYHDGTGIRLWTGKEIPSIPEMTALTTSEIDTIMES